jgi:hypothetical protein
VQFCWLRIRANLTVRPAAVSVNGIRYVSVDVSSEMRILKPVTITRIWDNTGL